jgi:oligopeptide/dipeptide ABC transporter ATP-binding protein
MTTLLEIQHLSITLQLAREKRRVVHDLSIQIGSAEALGLVGESGSGKSMTARSVLRLLPRATEVSGEILFEGRSVLSMSRPELQEYRRRAVAMIFQDPRAHINPVRTVGDFLTEAMRTVGHRSKSDAYDRAAALLAEVQVHDAQRRMHQYPHELSGGLLQRVMIAAALAPDPRLLIADEPTTALDVSTQNELMAILGELRQERGLSMLFITHDLELAAATCDRTAVMYAGALVEQQRSSNLHEEPLHPYTAGLVASRPSISETFRRLPVIPGRPLSAYEAPDGCAFAARCSYAQTVCVERRPELRSYGSGDVACHRAEELLLGVTSLAQNGGSQ